jgi:hypothetical protein
MLSAHTVAEMITSTPTTSPVAGLTLPGRELPILLFEIAIRSAALRVQHCGNSRLK